MARGKLCLCCNRYQSREAFAKGNVCDKCIKVLFKATVPEGTVIEGVQLLLDL